MRTATGYHSTTAAEVRMVFQVSSIELRRCAACNTALYCNRECQKAAWKRHKTSCKSIASCVQSGTPHEELVLAE
ncbi:hypothetical protein C8T65DRAFT_657587 [Cerioporus squamosus]|nr:hypothetical protein C8T65DRAFT_657587 [Cerioporus squamosus]